MIREDNFIYINGERKERYVGEKTPDFIEIKKTIRELERQKQRLSTKEDVREELEKIEEDITFWKHELDFVQNPSRKGLKKKYRKMKKEAIREKILKIIEETTFPYILHLSSVARQLNVEEKYVFQVFADLNKEGILSLARHKYPHDIYRSYNSGWIDDTYYILKHKDF